MSDNSNAAYVLVMAEGRFFVKFGKVGQVQTAWSLAGARLFGMWDHPDLEGAERRLTQRGKAFRRLTVALRSDEAARVTTCGK